MNFPLYIILYSQLAGPLAGIAMTALIVGLMVFGFRQNRKISNRNWDYFVRYAETFRIRIDKPEIGFFTSAMPQFMGDYGNVRLDIRSERRSSGKHTHYYTVINIYLRGANEFQVKVVKQGLLQKIGKALGMQDIITGNEEFDQKFILKSNDEERARQIFDFRFTNEFLAIENQLRGRIRLKNNSIHYEEMLRLDSENHLQRMIAITHVCVKLAEKAGSHGGRVYS